MSEPVEFKRDIGLFMAVMIGIGAMMGPGIFALPGLLAGMVGPLGVVAYLAMGTLTIFTALNYSELGAAIPLAGGGYSFTQRVLPAPVAFLTGWLFWIGNTLACAMYVLIFALTVQVYFWPSANLPFLTIATTVVFGAVNLKGMSAALKVITVMNLIELAVLIGVALFGAPQIEAANLDPVAPHGYDAFLPAMALIFVCFVGFDLITVAAEEIIDPARTIPRAIMITLAVGTALYVIVVWVMMGVVNHTELAESEVPFILVADRVFPNGFGRWAAITATIMASLSAFSVTLGASARILFALGRDGHFPKAFAKLHPKHQTPHVALFVCAVFVCVFSSSGIISFVASMASFGYLLGLGIVNFAALALRRRLPNLRRPFEVMLFPAVPIAGIIVCWAFVPSLDWQALALGSLLVAIGCGLYVIQPSNRAQFSKLRESIAYLWLVWKSRRRERVRVLIIGGGQQGQNVAKRLLARDEYRLVFRQSEHQLTFIEPAEELCKELEQRFNVPVFQGDGTKKELLEQVGLENIEVAIAAGDDDGKNVITALQAKRLGVRQVMAIVQDPDYLPLLEENGVTAISAPWATAAMVENHLDRPGVAELFEIGTGEATLIGVFVPEGGSVAGKQIKDIAIPRDCVIGAVIRGKDFIAPRGDTAIEVGDHVLFLGRTAATKSAHEVFTHKTT